MRGVDDRSAARFPRPLPPTTATGVTPVRAQTTPLATEAPKPQLANPELASTAAKDRARVEAQSNPLPPLIAAFVEKNGLGPRIDAVRAGQAGVGIDERATVRAQLQGLGAAELSALRDVLVLKPPHPELKKMRGHPAITGRPSLEGVLSILAGEPLGVAATRTAGVRRPTLLEAASPSPSVIRPGAPVRVQRSNGALDEGWTIRSRAPNGDVIVERPEIGATKQVSPAKLLADNPALLALGTPVQIRRTNGQLEGGWQILSPSSEPGQMRVSNGRGDLKDVPLETLLGLNPPLIGGAPLGGTAERVFAPMSPVTVTRSNGAKEPNWKILAFDPAERTVRVMTDGMSKSVDARELLADNPGLIPFGTPIVMPRSNGLHEDGWQVLSADASGVNAMGPGGATKKLPLTDILAHNPQLVEPATPPTTAGRIARVSGAALAQSESFRTGHIIPAGTPIVDGYIDGGRSAQVGGDGTVSSSREVLVVDRTRDGRLQGHLAYARSLRDLEPHARARALVDYVANLFTPPDGDSIRAANQIDRQFNSREVLIGEVPDLAGGGACRHRALMLKVLGDEAKLDIALQRGNAIFAHERGAHAWNVVMIEGKPYLADPMNPTRAYGASQLPRLDAPGNREAYVDVNWQPIYGGSS